jgi:hypothetical protein
MSIAENNLALVGVTRELTDMAAKKDLKITIFIMAICLSNTVLPDLHVC